MTINDYNAVILFFILSAFFFLGAMTGSIIGSDNKTILETLFALLLYFLPGFIHLLSFKKTISWFFIGLIYIITTLTLSTELIALSDYMSFEKYIEEILYQLPLIIIITILGFSFGHFTKDLIKRNSVHI